MPRFRLFGYETLSDSELSTPMANASQDTAAELVFTCREAEPLAATGKTLYLSPSLNAQGEPAVQLFEIHAATWLMRFPQVADFIMCQGEIECRLADASLAYMVDVLLLGHVMACYLEQQGVIALHAGALAVGGRAVLVLGHKGAGKSSMVTSMVTSGFPLIADDIAAIEVQENGVTCRSAFPQVKLTPEQLQRFAKGNNKPYPRFHPGFTKLSVPVDDLGCFHPDTLPVGAIYLLARGGGEPPSIETLPPARAVAELAKLSFLNHLLEAMPIQRERFNHLVRVARAVPVRLLRYPDGFDRLGDVHAAIVRDLGG
ncbi:hypothetical protein IEI94_10030 [Halomonas sp. ML-15]|uniref:hypothetical protein n=1 Tax=Halomonas sp. ML-15 TaxID=2773305 RepID=UPI001746BE38|nr:hypothetical protein [Halomonas sp. ML-15]MBD3896188.1 hypothetical protein [Halomonas sp. ML-15]